MNLRNSFFVKPRAYAFLLFLLLLLVACSDNEESNTFFTGFSGRVLDAASNSGIADARIMVMNTETREYVDQVAMTSANGSYELELEPGSYGIYVAAENYYSSPAAGTDALPIILEEGMELEEDIFLRAMEEGGGSLSGVISTLDAAGEDLAMGGVLLVLSNDDNAYSTISAGDGSYQFWNVEADDYELSAQMAYFAGAQLDVSISEGEESSHDIEMEADEGSVITGHVTFNAVENSEVSVVLVNPATGQLIPGLQADTEGGDYTISGIPEGTYLAQASYEIDGLVMDPDWTVKFGAPLVSVNPSSTTERDFTITGAVLLETPARDSAHLPASIVASLTPEFSWEAYSSTDDYVIEVRNRQGDVIWGGFTNLATTIEKNIIIEKSRNSVSYNEDGAASELLLDGEYYSWRIYASKDDNQDPLGWKIISASEEAQGVFQVDLSAVEASEE
jgi:hypothetical protein